MVSFKNLLVLGTALLAGVNAIPWETSGEHLLRARSQVDECKRDIKGRMTIQHSQQGRVLFLLGARFPQAVIDSFYGLGEGGPAKALLATFQEFIEARHQNLEQHFIDATSAGGVYGKGAGGDVANDYGFGFQFAAATTAAQLQDIVDAIREWASQGGGLVQVIQRPNGFFDPATIGAGEARRKLRPRSRGDQCPANTDLLQYATVDVEIDIDINKNIRWAGECQ
ncbi:hypothetical protein F4778DRAFT_782323 [Xylariomycetidae sp. FL2044]|nr:hypothetical protein F4778DRAFT_782323 [Xylariomycetidae sp. FL2044]